jgi:hypothetical protein
VPKEGIWAWIKVWGVQTFLGFVPVVLQKIFGSTRRSFVADRKSAYDSSVHQVRRIDLLERKGSEDMPHL